MQHLFSPTSSSAPARIELAASSSAPSSSASDVRKALVNVTCARAPRKRGKRLRGCVPEQCARYIEEEFVSGEDAAQLIALAEAAWTAAGGGGAGPASVLDLTSGAVSAGEHFIDVFQLFKRKKLQFDLDAIATYRRVKEAIQQRVQRVFGVRRVLLTSPAFFSRITAARARTMHDEYYHEHIDLLQYGSFVYTALVYLNEQGVDYQGGTFSFVNRSTGATQFVRPKTGLLSMFTSGEENPHRVDKVTAGTRYAFTIAFTCSPGESAEDDFLKRVPAAA